MLSVTALKMLQIGLWSRKICSLQNKFFIQASYFGSFSVLNNIKHEGVNPILQRKRLPVTSGYAVRKLYTSSKAMKKIKDIAPTDRELVPRENLFEQVEKKDKSSFLLAIELMKKNDKATKGHMEFIYAALRCMEEYGVQSDMEVYKKLMDVFPKGKMIPRNLIQAEFMHFPRQQECAIYLLDQMELYHVFPDTEMKEIVINVFGKSSHVFKKYARMLYWMPKLKNINPYVLPDPLPSSAEKLALLALKRMCIDRRTKITVFKAEDLEDSIDHTWIASAQAPDQLRLVKEHPVDQPIYVEGSSLIWLENVSISYFYLRAAPKVFPQYEEDPDDLTNLPLHTINFPKSPEIALRHRTIHEQDDGVLLAHCCTGTSSKDSLLSWIRFLQETNPKLSEIPVIFKIRSPPTSVSTVNVASYEMEGDTEESKDS